MSYARWRVQGLGRAALGRNAMDLFGEAVTATLAGTRRWQPDRVNFTTFLTGVMRSISSHWRDGFDEREAWLESDLSQDHQSREMDRESLLERAESGAPSAECVLNAVEKVAALKEHFQNEPEVLLVMEGIKEGMSGPEIQKLLELTQTQFETIMRRLRRRARTLFDSRGGA